MNRMHRRRFVSTAIQSAAGLAAAQHVCAGAGPVARKSAQEQVVLALIGAGGRGHGLANNFAAVANVKFKYVCDVEDARLGPVLKDLDRTKDLPPQPLRDMRKVFDDKDVDGVVIATPEHWHALATVWACQAGKDVYVEKNVSVTIAEGRNMIEAARKYHRIVQAGTENRSAPYAVSAREYLRSGKLGKVVLVKVYNLLSGLPWRQGPDSTTPAGIDWEHWLGPAARVPYNTGRHRDWYAWWDYSGGQLANDGTHQLDLARMVLGDPPHPRAVHCIGGNFAFGSRRQTPELQVISYEYDNFAMTCESSTFPPYMTKSSPAERLGKKWPFWPQNNERIEIYGTKQMMYLGRHGMGWQVLEGGGKIVAEDKGYHPDKWHQPNFVDCIRSRNRPNADIEQAHFSACLVHLGNLAYRAGNEKLVFDGQKESFVGNDTANGLVSRSYAKGFEMPQEV
jgi:predicted dehydrogenase